MPTSKPRFPEDRPIDHTVTCADIEESLSRYTTEFGYILISIFPADRPRVAVVEKEGRRVRLESAYVDEETDLTPDKEHFVVSQAGDSAVWHEGRAGMQYRDLIPDRLGGRLIASHISIPKGGPVPDYVHFHKVDFQVICCIKGWCDLVYEDQGPPFRFEQGDCVLQPPGIRHRVLECSDGFEVVELSSPAEHPTFAEHEIELPTRSSDPGRSFDGQRFVWHRSADVDWIPAETHGFEVRKTPVFDHSGGVVDVSSLRSTGPGKKFLSIRGKGVLFLFVTGGTVTLDDGSEEPFGLDRGSAVFLSEKAVRLMAAEEEGVELLCVEPILV